MDSKIKVLLSTEGTYPFHQGGVSQWCNVFVENLSAIDYIVYSIVMNPFVTQKFSLPAKTGMIKIPLWGTEDPSEHLAVPFSTVYTAKEYTDTQVVREHFIPLFIELINEIIKPASNNAKFGNILLEMYRYFKSYDYKNSFQTDVTWQTFKEVVLASAADDTNKLAQPSVFDLIQSLGWLYRFLVILNTPLPEVQVSHSTAAGFCGIPCALAKLERKTPYLLTEHGVYLREQYLSLSRKGYSSYLTTFLIRLIHSIVGLNYAMADQISPVCIYNTRWEQEFGVPRNNIRVIYNGVDRELFRPDEEPRHSGHLTVVSVARIDPVKDLITLIRAAAIVRETMPDVKFIVYGSVSVPEYFDECLELRKELKLENTFIFAGHTDDPPSAYRSGDVIALSSITEAFPYLVVEAMMSGKPVVATDVGGVKEALGECGLVVRPRRVEEFASALLRLLEDSSLRSSLGQDARERALNHFTIEHMLELYLNSYSRLAFPVGRPEPADVILQHQRLLIDRGYALADLGYWRQAITQFRAAIDLAADSFVVPVLLLEIAGAFNKLGKYELAFHEMEKAEILMEYGERRTA